MTTFTNPNLALVSGWAPNEDGWGVSMNSMLRWVDSLVQGHAVDRVGAVPGAPANGAIYIVAPTGTSGVFNGQENKIARWSSGDNSPAAWEFLTPKQGWRLWLESESAYYRYTPGGSWERQTDRPNLTALYAESLTNAPPGGPLTTAVYMISSAPTGAWAGNANKLAIWTGAAWQFFTPPTGMPIYNFGDSHWYVSNGGWGQVQSISDVAGIVSVREVSGTSGSVGSGDRGGCVRCTNAAAVGITVSETSVGNPLLIGTVITIRQVGAGQITLTGGAITGGGTVTINIPTGTQAKTRAQGSSIALHYVAANVWDLTGDLAAV